jgi:hypothetical protein
VGRVPAAHDGSSAAQLNFSRLLSLRERFLSLYCASLK